jgi:hypothetical protein
MDKKIAVEDLNMNIEESIKVMNNFIKNNQEKIGKSKDEIIKNMLALINDFSIIYTNCITNINKKFQNFETNKRNFYEFTEELNDILLNHMKIENALKSEQLKESIFSNNCLEDIVNVNNLNENEILKNDIPFDGIMIKFKDHKLDDIKRFFKAFSKDMDNYIKMETHNIKTGLYDGPVYKWFFIYSSGNEKAVKMPSVEINENHAIVFSQITKDFYLIDINKMSYAGR